MRRGTIRLQPLMNIQRKRVAAIVDEKSVTHTGEFLLTLESKMGFKISTVQTDNGRVYEYGEAVNESVSLMWWRSG